MKKLLLLFFVVASFQIIVAQNVTYGVKAGTNISSYVTNYGPFDYKYKIGFQVGGFVKVPLADRIFLQPELLYSLQGARFDLYLLQLTNVPGTDNPLFADGSSTGRVNESTMVLPIMFKYYFTNQFNVELGPQVDYLFKIKSKIDGYTNSDENSIRSDDDANEFNFGVNLGLGYDFNDNLGLGLRYNYGFNHLHSDITKRTGDKRNNSVFSLSLAYSID